MESERRGSYNDGDTRDPSKTSTKPELKLLFVAIKLFNLRKIFAVALGGDGAVE